MGWYGPRCSLLIALRLFIIIVSALGAASIFASIFLLGAASTTTRALIIVVGVVLLLVTAIAWKMTSMDVVGRRPVNNVFLRAYRAEYFDRDLPTCVSRHPAFLPFHCPTAPMTIPRPLVLSGDGSVPTILAPPPPPTYHASQRHHRNPQQGHDHSPTLSCAPPIYSICGALQRVCTNSPPPRYTRSFHVPTNTPQSPSNQSDQIDSTTACTVLDCVIDCSKPTPTTFHFPPTECSSI